LLLALVGLVLLVATFALRIDADDPNCASIVNPDRARECVASSAQTLDWELLDSILVIAAAVTLIAVGGALVARTRRGVMDIAEAAELLGTGVAGVRSLVANGDLASYFSHGRTYLDVVEVERLSRATTAPEGMASPEPA